MSSFSGRQYAGAKRDRRIEKRTEAEARNARHGVRLACGHTTTIDPTDHAKRCGAIA